MAYARNPLIVVQSMDPHFGQGHLWVGQFHALRPTYLQPY